MLGTNGPKARILRVWARLSGIHPEGARLGLSRRRHGRTTVLAANLRWTTPVFSGLSLGYCHRKGSTVNCRMVPPERATRPGPIALKWALLTFLLAMTVGASAFASSPTLTEVRARGSLMCGVNEG